MNIIHLNMEKKKKSMLNHQNKLQPANMIEISPTLIFPTNAQISLSHKLPIFLLH